MAKYCTNNLDIWPHSSEDSFSSNFFLSSEVETPKANRFVNRSHVKKLEKLNFTANLKGYFQQATCSNEYEDIFELGNN